MKREIACGCLAVLSLVAQAEIAVTNRNDGAVIAIPEPTAHVVYGAHPKQFAELWVPEGGTPPEGHPLAVYVHGGSWTSGAAIDIVMAGHLREFLDRGIAFASVSYRLLQDAKGATPPVAAVRADAVAAILKLKAVAPQYGIDVRRLGLAGGSAGACMSLVVGLSDGNPLGIRVICANYPQTSLDPKEMKAWIPNQDTYGAHAFGLKWPEFEARRDELLPTIERFSPAALARRIEPSAAPELILEYWPGSFPADGQASVKDPVHSAQFGIPFADLCKARGIRAELLKGPCKESWRRFADVLAGVDGADEPTYPSGAKEVFEYVDPSLAPITYGAEARAEGASATEFCIYLDILHADGTWTYGERAFFQQGTHGWHRLVQTYVPKKPVRKIQFNMLLRGAAKGKVLFRRPFAERASVASEVGVTLRSDMPFSDADVREGWRFDGRRATPFAEKVPRTLPTGNPLGADELAVWTAPSVRTVTPLDFPSAADRANRGVRLDLAKGESESFQVNLSAGARAAKDGVTLEFGAFAASDGTAFDGTLKWERVGYVKRESPYAEHPDAPPPTVRWLPDPLLPAAPMKVRAGGTQGAWVTAKAAPGAKAGTYRGTVRVRTDAETLADVAVEIRVRDFALPRFFGMRTFFAVMDGFTRAAYPDRYEEMRRQSWDVMLDHRLNPDDISRTEPPPVEDLVRARARGMSAFTVLNVVPRPKPGQKWVCCASPEETDTEAFYDGFVARFRPYYAELQARGLADFACIYGFDERKEAHYPGIARFWRRWKAEFPDVPLLTTAMMYREMANAGGNTNLENRLVTDWHCPLTPEYREDFSNALRAYGMKTLWYVCCSPRHPYANFASLECPPREARILGWQTWAFGSDGLLYWLVNGWPERIKLDESDTYFPDWPTANVLHMPGDGVLMYPGREHVLPSIRLACVRDGVEDYERLDAAAAKFGRELVTKAAKRVTPSMTDFDRTGLKLLGIRAALADRCEDRKRVLDRIK